MILPTQFNLGTQSLSISQKAVLMKRMQTPRGAAKRVK
jgi:hypothetical protein